MADFSALKQSIQNYIKQNGNKAITGNILQNILLSMVTTMGDGAINDNASDISELNSDLSDEINRAKGAETTTILFSDGKLVFKNAAGTVLYQLNVASFLSAITTRLNTGALYAGYATPSTTPAPLTGQEVFYLATQAGTYTNFHFNGGDDPIVLTKDGIYFIVSGNDDDDWNAEPMLQLDDVPTASSNNAVKSGGVNSHINNNDAVVSKLLNGYSKIIDTSYFSYVGYFNTSGAYIAAGSYKATPYITVDDYSKIVIIGGGSTNISYIVFYDNNKTVLSNEIPSSPYYLNVVSIPSNCKYVRFCLNNMYFGDEQFNLIGLCYDNITSGYNVNKALPKLSGFASFGNELKNNNFISATHYRANAINNVAGYIDKLYFCGGLTESYDSDIIRPHTFYILHLENNKATLKDSFDVMVQGGKNSYYNGLDFSYNKPLAVNDILAFKDTLHTISYESSDEYIGYNINSEDGSISITNNSFGLSYNIVPSMYDTKYGTREIVSQIIKDGSAFDLSAYNNGTTYADLSAALTALNALPAAYKKGGMSMKYVQTSDNKYVQYRLMTDDWSATPSDWQGVDDVPTAGSNNLVKSDGVNSHINNNDAVVSKLLNEYSKIIDISYFTYNGFFDTEGIYKIHASYKATIFIKVDSFSKIVLIGGGSTNISYIVFYDENKAILSNIVPSSPYYLNIVNIPSGCTYVRFCMHSTYFENGKFNLIGLCYGDVIANNVNDAVSKLSGFATFGKEIKNTQYAAPGAYRSGAINNVSGFIDKLYFCGSITEGYGSSIIRKHTFDILHLENNKATLKDSFDVMVQGGKNSYYNGLDFSYDKPLAVNDILAFKHEVYSVCYDNSTDDFMSYLIDNNNDVYSLSYAIGLSYNIVPSMCDAKYGIQKAKNQIDNIETYIRKSFVYNTGAKDADIIKVGGSYTATLVEGDAARTVYAMYIDEEQLNISLKPLTDYFDIRFGKRAVLAGTYVGIKKDANGSYISVYRHANTSDLSAASLVLAYQETLSFELLKNITYNITMQKDRDTNSTVNIIINSSDGRIWTKKLPCVAPSDNLQGLYVDGVGSMWGNITIFDVSGNVMFSNLQYRLPYKKNCQMVICGHSFVEGNSIYYKKQDRFVSLIQNQVGRDECCVLGAGGSGINFLTGNDMQVKALVNIFNYRPKYIVEVFGTNDSSMAYNTFISHLENFISFCETNDIIPVLTTIPPIVNSSVPLFAQVNEWIRNSEYKYADIEKCFVDASGNPIVDNYLTDGIHPTIETHLSIYNQILHDVPELFDFS